MEEFPRIPAAQSQAAAYTGPSGPDPAQERQQRLVATCFLQNWISPRGTA